MTSNSIMESSRRVHFLDELRGFIVLLMVFYHTVYDLVAIFRINVPFFGSPAMEWLRLFIASGFMLISGVACRYSRSNLRRGLQCFAVALLLSAATHILMPSQRIVFGILHMLGLSMILFELLRPLLDKLHPLAGIVLMNLLFYFTDPIRLGYLGFGDFLRIELPHELYSSDILFPMGIHGPFFFSADYYPLVPWFFVVAMGAYLGVFFKENHAPNWMYRPHIPFLSLVGRHALVIYVLHQPIAYGVIYLLSMILL